jgi:hypothetical protein
MNHDVFISYSHENITAAQAICHELEDKGIKCWMAPRDIPVGAKYASVISKAIVHSKIVVLVFSDYSARSPWVESEINIAFSNRKTIIPYKIDKTNYEEFDEFYLMLNNRHWIEAYPDYKTRFKELVTIVAQTLGRNVSASKPAMSTPTLAPAPIPTPTQKQSSETLMPTSKPNNLKRYWLVALCMLAVGCAMWYISTDKLESEKLRAEKARIEKENETLKHDNAELQHSNAGLLNSNSDLQKNINDFKTKEAQQANNKKKENVKDNSYLLNLPDDEFVQYVGNNGKYGYKLGSTGEVVIPSKYENCACFFREGLAAVKLNGKYGYIDKTGIEVIPLKYDRVSDSFREGLTQVVLKGKCGWIDKAGKEVIPLKYDIASDFNEGLAWVKLNGICGFVDKTGKEVIPLKYNVVSPFSKGKAKVSLNGKTFYIDKNGNRIE